MDIELTGKNIVLTGRFKQGKENLKEYFVKLGANIQTSVKTDTDILIIGEQPGTKQLDKFDMFRGAGYEIVLWEQNEVDSIWRKQHQEYTSPQTPLPYINDEYEDDDCEDDEECEKKRLKPWQSLLIELAIMLCFCFLIALSITKASLTCFIIGIVILAVAKFFNLCPIFMPDDEDAGDSGLGSLLGLFFVNTFLPTSRHRQYRGWQFGRRHKR